MTAPRPARLLLAFLLLAGAGCEDEDCNVATSDLSMVARVVDNGNTVRSSLDFVTGDRSGLPDPWGRCEDGELSVNGEIPTETNKGDRIEYSATWRKDDPNAPTDVVPVIIDRHDARIEFVIDLPPAFDVVEPQNGVSLSRASDVELVWEPPVEGGSMLISLFERIGGGTCLLTPMPDHQYKRSGVSVDDTGRWTVPAGALEGPLGDDCAARYQLVRFQTGEYPEGLKSDGFVEARVERQVLFTSVP